MTRATEVVVAGVVMVLFVIGAVFAWNRLGQPPEPNHWPDRDLGADEVVVYKTTESRPLHVHLFRPDGDAPAPAVVFFHGGGLERTPLEQFVPQAEALASIGVAGVVAEYRVAHDGDTPASSLADASDAVKFLSAQAGDLGLDPDRIGAGGGSAGGWLASSTAADADALALFNPAVQPDEAPSADIPIIMFHGDRDRTVDISRSEGYCAAAVSCRLEVWPGGDHGFFNEMQPEAHRATTEQLLAFFAGLGWGS